jgi:hypothetical protein
MIAGTTIDDAKVVERLGVFAGGLTVSWRPVLDSLWDMRLV